MRRVLDNRTPFNANQEFRYRQVQTYFCADD